MVELSENIPTELVIKLSLKLGFTKSKAFRFAATNVTGVAVNTTGTLQMLHEWQNKTKPHERKQTLVKALMYCNLVESAEEYNPDTDVIPSVPDEVDEAKPSTTKQLVRKLGLGRSTSSGYVGMVSFKQHREYRLDRPTKSQRDSMKQAVNGLFESITD